MKLLLKTIGAWIGDQTRWLVLLLVAGVAAFLYVQFAQMRGDRDQLLHAAELICAGSGVEFPASVTSETDTNGKPVTIDHARGAICQRQVAMLASFKAGTDQKTAETLAQALADHDARQNRDSAAARSAAEAASSAAKRMEAADAEAERKNVVDRMWFAAVNGVAGLRPPEN